MTTYATPTGNEIVVCDSCGIAEDGSHPDLSALKPVDLEEGLRACLKVEGGRTENFCPVCGPYQKGATQEPCHAEGGLA